MNALFVDVGNLLFCVSKKFPNRKLDYNKLYVTVNEYGTIHRACAYNHNITDKSNVFNGALKKIGYDVKSLPRQSTVNVVLTIDAIRVSERVESITISSASADLVPLINYLKDKGVRTVIYGALISRELRDAADFSIEITEDMLFEPVQSTV